MAKHDHFIIEKLAPGVFTARASPTGAAVSNSGIIDLGDQTIVFDTTATLSAAKALLVASQELTGRAPAYVINSHSHPDHIQGNAVFSETSVLISSVITRAEIARNGVQSMANMRNDLTTQITLFHEQLALVVNAPERAELQAAIGTLELVLSDYPSPDDLRLPHATYQHEMNFHGTERSAQLRTFGGAHSACDAVLWLPENKILYAGDIIGNPVLCLGHPEKWWTLLDQLESYGAEKVVPGHGGVWSRTEGFAATRHHINFMFGFAEQAMDTGDPLNFAETVQVPTGHNEYWFRQDLRFLVEHRLKGNF